MRSAASCSASGSFRMSHHTGVLSKGIALSKESSVLIQRLVPCTSILPPAAMVSSTIWKYGRQIWGILRE